MFYMTPGSTGWTWNGTYQSTVTNSNLNMTLYQSGTSRKRRRTQPPTIAMGRGRTKSALPRTISSSREAFLFSRMGIHLTTFLINSRLARLKPLWREYPKGTKPWCKSIILTPCAARELRLDRRA